MADLFPTAPKPGAPYVAKCLGDAVEQGRLTREQAEEALAYVNRLMEKPGTSEGAAAAEAARLLQENAETARRQTALQILKTERRVADAESHPDGMAAGVAAIFARDLTGKARYGNLEGRIRAIRGELHARTTAFLESFRLKTLGLTRDTLGLTDMVRALYGDTSVSAIAQAAAKGWADATDYAASRFNAAGGTLRRLENWRLPQVDDSALLRRVSRAEWEGYMHDQVAAGKLKIVDWQTGDSVDALRQADIISQAWETISSDGLNKLEPGVRRGSAKLANARQEKRAFEWTSAEAWLDHNRRWGVGDAGIFDLLTGHIDGMARDIGALETLGPNPEAMSRVLVDMARKAGASKYRVNKIEATYLFASGQANSPVSGFVADIARGVRSWLSAAQLGSAVLSSTADFATMKATALWNGIPATRVMATYLKLLNPANAADQRTAVRLGLIAEGWATRAAGANRMQIEEIGSDFASRTADFIMRASGLAAHTQAGKWAFGMEFLGTLADQAGRRFDALQPIHRDALVRYGISAADWDLIRAAPMLDEGRGVKFLWPEAIAGEGRAHQQAASKLLELVQEESRFAMVEPGAAERALILGKTQAGTISGEFWRATAQYKSFPITMMTRHLVRGMEGIRGGDRGLYMVGLVAGLTVMGAAAMQLKAIAQGKDPRDMADWKFWGAAFFQGGGAGIFGDFLNAGLNRADRSFFMTAIGGPTAGFVDDLAKLTGANIAATAAEKDAHWGRDLARFVQRNTPGSSLWYARLAVDRLLWDHLNQALDPNWQRTARDMHKRARKEFDQEYFWGPADPRPRAPDLSAAFRLN